MSLELLIETIKDSGYTKQQKLDALSDGHFLSHFEATQDEVEELYYLVKEGK